MDLPIQLMQRAAVVMAVLSTNAVFTILMDVKFTIWVNPFFRPVLLFLNVLCCHRVYIC